MPTRERRQKGIDKKKEDTRLEDNFGPRPSVSEPNLNSELGENLGRYNLTTVKFDENGDPYPTGILVTTNDERKRGSRETANNADYRCKAIKKIAGPLWGQTEKLDEIQQLWSHVEFISKRTLRRYFKRCP